MAAARRCSPGSTRPRSSSARAAPRWSACCGSTRRSATACTCSGRCGPASSRGTRSPCSTWCCRAAASTSSREVSTWRCGSRGSTTRRWSAGASARSARSCARRPTTSHAAARLHRAATGAPGRRRRGACSAGRVAAAVARARVRRPRGLSVAASRGAEAAADGRVPRSGAGSDGLGAGPLKPHAATYGKFLSLPTSPCGTSTSSPSTAADSALP